MQPQLVNCSVTEETLESLMTIYQNSKHKLQWDPLFVLPSWLKAWWEIFGDGYELLLLAIWEKDALIGIAPLKTKDETASFVGSCDVADYMDFIIFPQKEKEFFSALMIELKTRRLKYLDVKHFRPESRAAGHLVGAGQDKGFKVQLEPDEMTMELTLPGSWEEYLAHLSKKQRHEVRRKIRRLEGAGEVNYYTIEDSKMLVGWLDTFFNLFRKSRRDKDYYMTPSREGFFRKMSDALAKEGLLKIGVLELNKIPIAVILYFDFENKIFLYNSGYHPDFRHLSPGLLSKVCCIRDSIEKKREVFDFLKGNEVYKYRLGGSEVPLFRCLITIS